MWLGFLIPGSEGGGPGPGFLGLREEGQGMDPLVSGRRAKAWV